MDQNIVASTGGGVYDFTMREYSPAQGRWWTPDPAGLAAVDPAVLEPLYLDGTALNSTDPLGLFAHLPPGCVGMPTADPTTGEYYMCRDYSLPFGHPPVDPADVDPAEPGGGGTGGSGVTST